MSPIVEAMVKTGAAFKRGKSKQDYATPRIFLDAVEKRFGKITFDLAASPENAVCENYYTKEQNAFLQNWKIEGNLWLNPPFDKIEPWAKMSAAAGHVGVRILFLVPASVGSEWFAKYVEPYSMVYALSPRLSFDGKNPYPKDCILAAYGFGVRGFSTWRWRK